jgi:hypothetical protein
LIFLKVSLRSSLRLGGKKYNRQLGLPKTFNYMKISRRNFIKLGSAAAFVGTNFVMPVSALGQKTPGSLGVLSPEALDDPFFYLTAADFKKYTGTEFLLFTETGAIAAVLSNVTQIKAAKSASRAGRKSNQPVAETFSLSFGLPIEGFTQATYRVQHLNLGEFDLFLVPEANSKFLLHAVINRI